MKKFLITGVSGFVGAHFIQFLAKQEGRFSVLGVDLFPPPLQATFDAKNVSFDFERLDMLDGENLESLIFRFQPTFILHLASFSSVSFSWQEPVQSFKNNTNIFLNLVEAVRRLRLKTRILSVGSSEEYGPVEEANLPLTEDVPLNPQSPYAVARAAQELLSKVYHEGFGLEIILTRSFNHFGPGQKEIFVLPSFAKQIVESGRSNSLERVLRVGNLDISRDFVDVRDVVAAYYSLFEKGCPGEIYNVCSGQAITLRRILDEMGTILGISVKAVPDPQLFRPNEILRIVGSREKIRKETGWEPKIPFSKSITDLLSFWDGQA